MIKIKAGKGYWKPHDLPSGEVKDAGKRQNVDNLHPRKCLTKHISLNQKDFCQALHYIQSSHPADWMILATIQLEVCWWHIFSKRLQNASFLTGFPNHHFHRVVWGVTPVSPSLVLINAEDPWTLRLPHPTFKSTLLDRHGVCLLMGEIESRWRGHPNTRAWRVDCEMHSMCEMCHHTPHLKHPREM